VLFISYASEDKRWVAELSNDVQRAGIEVWVDREDLIAGDHWREKIIEAIDECAAMVVVLSQASAASREVSSEAEAANKRDKRIIPIIKDACDPRGMELILNGRQWIDFSTGDHQGGVRQLVAALTGGVEVRPESQMSSRPAPRQIVRAWQVWIQHPMFPGFGNFQFHPDGVFSALQSQPQGTVQIQG